MIQLVYVSSAVKPFTDQELLGLLQKAREANRKLGITGMLLYKNGEFMQALEGGEQEVLALADRISKDPRHRDIRIILKGPARQREFPDWTMGFRNLNEITPEDVAGYSTFLDSPLRSQAFIKSPAFCHSFLMLFKTKPERVAVKIR